jgi:hypothetical protein
MSLYTLEELAERCEVTVDFIQQLRVKKGAAFNTTFGCPPDGGKIEISSVNHQ